MSHAPKFSWRECFLHGILLIILLACVFPGTFLRGEMISPGYVLLEMLPWKAAAQIDWPTDRNLLTWEFLGQYTGWYSVANAALAQGEWPLWNPLEHTGVPLLANYQSAVFYPFRLLHSLPDFHFANTLFVLLRVWLCGLTAYLCGRGIGLGRAASRFLSIGYMLSMFIMTWTYWGVPDGSAWLPLLLLGVEYLLDGRHRKGFLILGSGATLILLAGHVETVFTMSLGVGVYFFLRLIWERRWGKRLWLPVGLAGGAWLLALAFCAIQILPFLEYLVNSSQFHERTPEAASELSLPVGGLVLFWCPRFYGITADETYWWFFWNSNYTTIIYPGIAVWAGLLLLASRSERPSKHRARVVCLLLACAFAIFMTFNHPAANAIKGLPVFRWLWHIYHFAFAVFALPLLGAIGLDKWLSRPRNLRNLWPLMPATIAVATLLIGAYMFHSTVLRLEGRDEYVQSQLLIAGLFAALTLGALAGSAMWHRPRFWGAALCLILAGDLLVASRGLHPTTPRDRLYVDTELTTYLREQEPPPRVGTTSATIAKGVVQYYGIEQWLGYDGMYPLRIMRFWEGLGPDLWNAMEPACAIKYYLHLPELHPFFPRDDRGGFEVVRTLDGLEVYENTMAFPRAYLVGNAQVVPEFDEMLAIMRDPEFEPGETALLEAPLPFELPQNERGDLGEATFLGRTNNTAEVHASVQEECILVLADAYFPGWEATVDGEPAEIFPVYSVFRGIVVPPGEHSIVYRYRPRSFRVGLAVSTLVLLLSAAVSLGVLVSRRRR